MSNYIPVPVESDPTDLASEAFDYLGEKVPGWLPSPGNLEGWLVEALTQIAGELRALIALVPDEIFAYYGESVLGLPRRDATQATGYTTWTARDTLGYAIPAGSVVAIEAPGTTDSYAFGVVNDATIVPGQTSLAGVEIRALEPGAAASGIQGDVTMIDVLDGISTVVLDGPTTGGSDEEPMDEYLSRLSALCTLLTPRPILPHDFAVMAMTLVPGVERATAIDLYNPDTGDTNCPRCVTVVCVDDAGNPCSPEVKQQVDDLLQREREVNFLSFVVDATYTQVAVTFDVKCYPNFKPEIVVENVIATLTDYLSPAYWGSPPYGDPGTIAWVNDTMVRYLEVAEQINRADGVFYIISLAIGIEGGTMGTADVPLTGVAPMPQAGTITGTAQP